MLNSMKKGKKIFRLKTFVSTGDKIDAKLLSMQKI